MQWDRLVDSIRADNTSGAVELARTSASAVLEWTDHTTSLSLSAWKAELSAFASGLYMAQPAMAPLFNLVNTIFLVLETASAGEELRSSVRTAAQAFLAQLTQANERLTHSAMGLLPPSVRVLTFSYSSSILAVLLEARARQRLSAVCCTESRPMLEGQRLARDLVKAGIPVEFGIDAAIATFIERTDLALVGADSITARGVVNKLGTTNLALTCRHAGIPCYVVADRHKWLPAAAATPVFSQAKPATEVWSDHPPGVTIWNTYFECTPMTLFSGIVGEDGPQGPAELLRQLLEMPVAQILRGGSAGAS